MVEETRAAIALGASFLATIVVVPVMKQVALAIGLVDLPSSRKVHQRPMPYLGGLAISFGTVAALMAVAGLTAPSRWLVLGAVGVGTIGLLDDHRSLSPKLRLGGEFVFAGMVAWSGTRLAVTGDTVIDAGISAFVLVALTNALNLCDNMDGLAAGLCAAGASAVLIVAARNGNAEMAVVAATLVGALLGFLAFNAPPAAIFMGDCGSLFLGFMLAGLGMSVAEGTRGTHGGLLVALTCAVLVLDTCTVVVARKRSGRKITDAGKDHLSHRLVACGLSRPQAVGTLVLVACATAFAGGAVAAGVVPPFAGAVLALGCVLPIAVVCWTATVYPSPDTTEVVAGSEMAKLPIAVGE